MKSEHVKDEASQQIKYPCLMTIPESGLIVLMICRKNGVVLKKGESDFDEGLYESTFEMNYFVPLPSDDKVILQND